MIDKDGAAAVAPENRLQNGLIDGGTELGQVVAVEVDEAVDEIRRSIESARLNGVEVNVAEIEDGHAPLAR